MLVSKPLRLLELLQLFEAPEGGVSNYKSIFLGRRAR